MANVIGIIVLAAFTTGIALLVPDQQVRRPLWFVVLLALAAVAIFSWCHEKAPRTPRDWLFLAILSIPVAILLCLVDGAVALLFNPSTTFLEALKSNGMVIVNLAISPFGTAVAIAGWVRSIVLQRSKGGG